MYTNRALRKLILPLIIEQALAMLVGMADTMMISHAGEAAVSGVALVDMVNTLILTVLTAVATGGAVIVSQYLGSRDAESACHAAGQLQALTLLLSLALAVLCLAFHRALLTLLFGAVEPDVMQAAVTYFLISCASFPFMGIYQASAALFRSDGQTRMTMAVSLLENAVNLAGNAIGIFVLRAGVAGVAVPTLISRAVAGCAMLCLAMVRKQAVRIRIPDMLTPGRAMLRRILRIAVPNGIENGLFTLGRVLVTSIVALFGTSQIAANGVASCVDQFAIIIVNAVNIAAVAVVGQCVGAQAFNEAAQSLKKLMRISYAATAALSVLVWLLLPWLRGLYSLSDETWSLCTGPILAHNAMAILLHPTSFNLANGLRAAGDAKFTMVIGIASMLVFRLGTAYLLGIGLGMGVRGVWVAMGMDWLGRSVAFVLRFRSGRWKSFRAI